jgi:hypothetical protein
MMGLEIISGVERRRRWSAADKLRIVAEADEPGAKVAEYPSGEPHLPFRVKPLSLVLMDDLKVAHKYGGR